MLCVAGTVPSEDFPLVEGTIRLLEDSLYIDDIPIDINRGTPALLGAAAATSGVVNGSLSACLVGDTGTGKGSRRLYAHLAERLPDAGYNTLAFHYLQPVIHWHRKLQAVLASMNPRPLLIADAGFMYVAKMSGEAPLYDLFTPDAGELAFLADEEAPHPFYTRGFILHEENRVPDLIERAYRNGNAARYLIVKGSRDWLAGREGILETVDHPSEKAMEAMGGTGDTLTGIVAALIDSGMTVPEAALVAMKTNRVAGSLARPTPASQVLDIIHCIPEALHRVLEERKNEANA